MYIRILKRHNRYVAEMVTKAVLDEKLQSLCLKLRNMGVKKGLIIADSDDAFNFNDFERKILKEFIPD